MNILFPDLKTSNNFEYLHINYTIYIYKIDISIYVSSVLIYLTYKRCIA